MYAEEEGLLISKVLAVSLPLSEHESIAKEVLSPFIPSLVSAKEIRMKQSLVSVLFLTPHPLSVSFSAQSRYCLTFELQHHITTWLLLAFYSCSENIHRHYVAY